jgi:hypothetical protein
MPVKASHTSYIFPPRPTDAIPREDTDTWGKLGWYAQYKYNDARTLIKYLPNGTIELWGRHGEKFRNYKAPDFIITELTDLRNRLGLDAHEYHLLDGGLLDFKHEAIRDTIAIWDILVQNGEHQLGTEYDTRYKTLYEGVQNTPWFYIPPHGKHEPIQLGSKFTEHLFIPDNWQHRDWPTLWTNVDKINAPYLAVGKGPVIEGMVIKDPHGLLERGWKEKNNGDWMTRSRVTTGRHKF